MTIKISVCKLTDKFTQNNSCKEYLKKILKCNDNLSEKLTKTYYDYIAKKYCLYKRHSKL
jgi:hypothetical protein